MAYAILFPGQGSQFVGMGADLFEARDDLLGERADGILGWSLRDICLNGPDDVLTRTEHAQPALFALSVALWAELSKQLTSPPTAAAGHSLGEYSALVAAGVFDFDAGLRVVGERGRAMQTSADVEPSGMAALLGADIALATAVCEARNGIGGRLSLANINAPGQVVVAGGIDDLEWLDGNARDLGVRRAVRLKVAGAFHSPFMAAAANHLAAALAEITVAGPQFDVYGNVTAAPVPPEAVVENLVVQVVSPVRFAETLEAMASTGIDTFVHVGPGDVTAGMAKRTIEGARIIVVSELGQIGDAVAALA